LKKTGLRTLLAGFDPARFLREHWPVRPLVVHGSPKRLAGLVDLPGPGRLKALLEFAQGEVVAQTNDRQHGFVNVAIDPRGAPALFRRGLSLYAPNALLGGRDSARWLATLEHELGLDPRLTRPAFFVSPKGSGANLHFDSQESFVIQLAGRKRWTYAPNTDLEFPPVNYVAGTPVPEVLARLRPRGFITRTPKDAVTVELKPGSVFFVPRGTWHQTLTLEDSLHVDLTLQVPTFADAVTRWLHRYLSDDARWRTPMVTKASTAEVLEQLRVELAQLLASIRS
jgi:ribosomal protein L16 Arg81 hydroxylase